VFHESANFASLHLLPVVFVCENNLYSVYTPLRQRQPDRPMTDLAKAHGMHAAWGDGNSLNECYRLAVEAVSRARDENGPTFLVFNTYRWREHCGPAFDNNIGYRTENEFQSWVQRDPLRKLRGELGSALTASQESAMLAEITAEVEDARAFARSTPMPDPSQASDHVYA